MKVLLEIKKKLARRRPKFIRSESHRKKGIIAKWRKPRGTHSKIRRKRRGKVAMPNPGFRTPVAVRGLTRHGLKPVEVMQLSDLEGLDSQKETLVIRNVGQKRRVELLKKAIEKKLTVLNFKKPEEHIKKVEDELAKRKASSKKKKETQKKKKAESVKKAEETQKKEEKTTEDKPETAKGSKSDKIKTLEKKQ